MVNYPIITLSNLFEIQGEAAAASDKGPATTSPETTSTPVAASSASTSRSGGGGGWGKLKGTSQASTPVQSTAESKPSMKKQDSGESGAKVSKPKLGALGKDDGSKSTRRSLEQSDVILGQSFTEFKSDIKKEVAEVHSKISNMEDLLKNILQNMEK